MKASEYLAYCASVMSIEEFAQEYNRIKGNKTVQESPDFWGEVWQGVSKYYVKGVEYVGNKA